MNCKNCGAILNNGKCKYCGSVFLEDMRYIVPNIKVDEEELQKVLSRKHVLNGIINASYIRGGVLHV